MTCSCSDCRNHSSVRTVVSISVIVACLISACVAGNCQANGDSAEQHAAKGLALAKAKDLFGAEQELRLAVTLSPRHAEFQAQLGSILGLEGKLGESEKCFERAVSFEPSNDNYRMEWSAVGWQVGRPVDAETNLEAILRTHPTDHTATLLLGMVEDSQGNCRKAVTLFNAEAGLVAVRPELILAAMHSY
jgi:Flp pilus assembly protein TadD